MILHDVFKRPVANTKATKRAVDKHIGDSVMCVFRAPVTHDCDPERAVRAAITVPWPLININL